MAEAAFKHGNPIMVDYTPASGNIAEGVVIVDGTVTANTAGTAALVKIAHRPIVNNTQGAVSVGGGVYAVTNLNNAVNSAKVYWDDTNNKVTTVSTNNAKFGYVVASGGGGANTTCYCLHDSGFDG